MNNIENYDEIYMAIKTAMVVMKAVLGPNVTKWKDTAALRQFLSLELYLKTIYTQMHEEGLIP